MKAYGDTSFYSFTDFPIPSEWKLASGGEGGIRVIGKNPMNEEVYGYYTSNGIIDKECYMDYYKIQYRYYEVEI
jgi:hypothetical protein